MNLGRVVTDSWDSDVPPKGRLCCFESGIFLQAFQGGEPSLRTVGKMVLNDWQRAGIPFSLSSHPMQNPQQPLR